MTHEALAAVAARQGITVEQLVSRLVEVRDAYAADPSRCSWCETPLPAGGRSRYCPGDGCRRAMSRARVETRRKAQS